MSLHGITLWIAYLAPLGDLPCGADEIAAQIRRLAWDKPRAERLAALKRLIELEDTPEAVSAISTLALCCKDPDAELRSHAVRAVAAIAFLHKKPTPLVVVRALFDADEGVRSDAHTYVGAFQKHPERALPLFLRAVEHADPAVRGNVLLPLAELGGKQERVLIALGRATADKDAVVRNNAQVALWKLTGDLEAWVKHLLSTVEAVAESKRKGNRQATAKEQTAIELLSQGASFQLRELGKERPAEFADVLIGQLSQESPLRRRAAARTLGAIAGDNEKAKKVVQERKVDQELQKLLKDADATVRAAAETALGKIVD